MQTPDLDQIKRWASGKDKPPPLAELTAIGTKIGARRKDYRAKAEAEGELMRALVPVLYREGLVNLAEMMRVLDTTYLTIDKELTKAGYAPTKRTPRGKKAADGDAA